MIGTITYANLKVKQCESSEIWHHENVAIFFVFKIIINYITLPYTYSYNFIIIMFDSTSFSLCKLSLIFDWLHFLLTGGHSYIMKSITKTSGSWNLILGHLYIEVLACKISIQVYV